MSRDEGSRVMPEEQEQKRLAVLVVDDEDSLLRMYRRILDSDLKICQGYAPDIMYEVVTARNGTAALEILASREVAMIISDNQMPGMTGQELLARVRENYPNPTRMMISGTEVPKDGIAHYHLPKPFDSEDFRWLLAFGLADYHRRCGQQSASDPSVPSGEKN